jgi:hypothetical protein
MVIKWAKERVKQAKSQQKEDSNNNNNKGDLGMLLGNEGDSLSGDFSQGFGISGVLDAEADLDIEALLSTWGAQEATQGQTPGVMTPYHRTTHAPLHPVDLTTARLEELFGTTTQGGDDVFPLDLPQEDLAASALFGPMMFGQDFQKI